jgi:hypothetical protein
MRFLLALCTLVLLTALGRAALSPSVVSLEGGSPSVVLSEGSSMTIRWALNSQLAEGESVVVRMTGINSPALSVDPPGECGLGSRYPFRLQPLWAIADRFGLADWLDSPFNSF